MTITGDKGKGVLGEADLNLSDYLENEYKTFKLPLKNCADADAFIEVGLRATQAKEKHISSRASIKGAHGAPEVNKDQMILLM